MRALLASVMTAGLTPARHGARRRARTARRSREATDDAPALRARRPSATSRIVSAQLGRPARNVVGIAARCVCGAPTVVATRPRLDDGTPFPTLYYLTHPAATAAMSTSRRRR